MEPSPLDPVPAVTTPASTRPVDGNLVLASLAGLVAALVGAVLWAALAATTHFKIGFAAVGIGFLVGWTMRAVGRGHSEVYGYVGAVLSLLGCVVGDVLSDCAFASAQFGQPLFDLVTRLTPALAVDLFKAGFQPLDALFYFIALSAGYRNAFIKQ